MIAVALGFVGGCRLVSQAHLLISDTSVMIVSGGLFRGRCDCLSSLTRISMIDEDVAVKNACGLGTMSRLKANKAGPQAKNIVNLLSARFKDEGQASGKKTQNIARRKEVWLSANGVPKPT
jgi:hypothetical protein